MSRSKSIPSPRIDAEWFLRHLQGAGRNSADLARHLGIHRSAVSRIWTGERKFKSTEVRGVASFLGVTADEILAHANLQPGFGEDNQAPWGAVAEDEASTGDIPSMEGVPMEKKRARHPSFGSMKGTSIVESGTDLTEPAWTADSPDKVGKKPYRHPAWGAMKGTFTLLPGVDLTEPADPEWGKVYEH